MKLFIAKEPGRQETRAALLPSDAGRLVQLGAEVEVAAGIGRAINVSDEEYEKAGAKVSSAPKASLAAEMVLRMGVPDTDDVEQIGEGAVHISLLDPFNNTEVVQALAARKVSAISLEMIPRTTIAQKMDVLSSQANLAGYVAVILAASRQNKILPMMMTPAGTIAPARVFVIGAGVAGLQAIATAKRLGARVDAFDVRPEAQEQILSLGAKPLKVDLGETGQTKDGYAKKLTDEQLAKQREAMARQCALSDIVITTAKVFGKKAPLIVTNEMIDGMQPGSVIVDLAVETGGNVEGSKPDKEVQRHGVTIIGRLELPRRVPAAASQMFSSNLYNFVEHFWHKETKRFILNREDAIIQGCLITHAGEIVHPAIQEAIA
ncbi:MAG: NAD(P) transhydrogenase subunit alpha [Sedimentisphaerales bacterium]|jgi:NAD(P) transhydrogenase subunit alpha|nr:NAD(P) transhydrogenase subunit alpha [Sedimentisphaerales bacterium]NLT76443.1 NAD(P) transhydrogenase subunit alpha [Planctomycetota bacterium]